MPTVIPAQALSTQLATQAPSIKAEHQIILDLDPQLACDLKLLQSA